MCKSSASAPGVAWALLVATAVALRAQPPSTVPPEGLRDNTPAVHALVNARVVTSPGNVIERGTVIIRDGGIVAVGPSADVRPPGDARVWDLEGKTVYPGLIDAYGELAAAPAAPAGTELLRPANAGAAHWSPRVAAQVRADQEYRPDAEANRKLRSQGVVARLVAPSRQVVRGTSAAVTTGDADGSRAILRPVVAMHVQLTPPAGPGGPERAYPVSPMGAVALVRQAMLDAQWYARARAAWEADPALPRPEANDALEALGPVVAGLLPVMIDAPDEQYVLRADRLAREFKLSAIVRGSGQEYRRLAEVAATGRAIVVPVNFARPPNVASPESARAYALDELMDWDLQPENPARLHRAGVKIALTSHGLRDKGTFLAAVRKAVARGLPADAALAALTTTPAELLGLARTHGTIAAGRSASLLVTDGELFDEKTKVIETWVDGVRHEVTPLPKEEARGTWAVTLGEGGRTVTLRLGGDAAKPRGRIVPPGAATRPASRPARGAGAELSNVAFSASRLTFTMKDGAPPDTKGLVQVSVVVSGDEWLGTGVRPDGTRFVVTAERVAPYDKRDDPAERESPEGAGAAAVEGGSLPGRSEPPPGEREQPTTRTTAPQLAGAAEPPATRPVPPAMARQAEKASTQPALFDVNYPLGAFGRAAPPPQPPAVLFVNATVWTCGPRGKLARAHVLVERGRIAGVYADGPPLRPIPADVVVVDCEGKHLTPGIIDCHSHIATDGGVNEGSQSITCEVRIADFIDPDDVNIYRQLAGGVTVVNVLHGSANTIGGQNQVVKLRWGASAEEMKFAEAPPGVKFALGENPKRSNFRGGGSGSGSGERAADRYPASRMGVEQIVRDAFTAALDYKRQWERYRAAGEKGIPPRVDLELEALLEIVEGRRLIHCHSYRQDEILALLRTCEAFGVRIATLQHVLEGYKVADAIARHGAGGSTFSDWWAYKYEVFDAIPYGGALMHGAGVIVSFNSDDAELARRLNAEAGKAVKYGGVPEEEALKFVTLNPARQLRVDRHVGSIEPGKHADLVVWSGPPMSPLSRCEQTWIDGRRYFDRQEDLRMRQEAQRRRAALVQKILAGGERMADEGDEPPPARPRDLWRHGEECKAGDCGGSLFEVRR